MHELGLLQGVVTVVEKAAASAGATGVEKVGLRVGTISGAIPEALDGAWPIVIAGTILEGAVLDIEVVTAAVWCPTCEANQPIDEFFALTCPVCGTPTGQLVAGREFAVTYADLTTPPDQ
ncbi:MAG: hydrogenase maturation nickel metallochaperone HypA [Propionibacteriaceae bacterium]|nr:hydrogenase maturation nickel metallochaperone HypA [Propionibacteriaceae bacterium]